MKPINRCFAIKLNSSQCGEFLDKNKYILVIAVVVALVVGFGVGVFAAPHIFSAMHPGGFTGGSTKTGSSAQVVGTLFSSFQFEQYAYQLSGNATLSASGKIATGDFNITTTEFANGSTKYSLKFDELGTIYNVTIGRGDKLYFIDTNLGDDMHGSDASFGDDGYAVVNSTGYIVAYKYPLLNT